MTCLVKAIEKRTSNLIDSDDIDDETELLEYLEDLEEEESPTEVNLQDIAPELISLEETVEKNDVPTFFDVKVFDGAALVHLLSPTAAVRTFEDYANDIFIP